MFKAELEATGLKEAIGKQKIYKSGLPIAVYGAVKEGMEIYHQVTATYPEQRSGVLYTRTGTYGRTQLVKAMSDGNTIWGQLNFKAPYSIYIRGNLSGYPGAWQMRGIWENLVDAVSRLNPRVFELVSTRIRNFIKSVNG